MSKKLELNLDDEAPVAKSESQLIRDIEAEFDEPLVIGDNSQANPSQTIVQPIIGGGFKSPSNDASPPIVKPIVTSNNQTTIEGKGKLIALRMLEQGYHPVIFVGSSNTGKTAVLSSLIALLKTTPGVGVDLGQPLIDVSDGYGEEVYRSAKTYFNHAIIAVTEGTAQGLTRVKLPFFIPLEVSPLNKPPQKFAFLEISGERYEPKEDSDDYFPVFDDEIQAVMRHYDKPITVIYTAPLTQNEVRALQQPNQAENDAQMRTAGLAIEGGITRYKQVRNDKSDDHHIFILTKWDALLNDEVQVTDAIGAISRRDGVMFNLAHEFAQKHYERSYAAFLTLPVRTEQKYLLPYSSGLMTGREIAKSERAQPHLNEYRKTLWNLLSAASQQSPSDVMFPKPVAPQISVWQQMWTMARKILG